VTHPSEDDNAVFLQDGRDLPRQARQAKDRVLELPQTPSGAGGLGVDGVGGWVLLAGLPDGRVPVVLPCVVDGHPHPEGEGGLVVPDGLASVGLRWSAGTL
jgi:hypothetical protein